MNLDAYIFIIAVVVLVCIAGKNCKENVQQWLLWPCMEAERLLGSGTGQAKLRSVYDAFMQRYPALKYLLPFSVFSLWVDEVLVVMRKQIQSNPNIAAHVSSGQSEAE